MAVLLAALGDNDPQFRLDAANVLLNGRADARAIEPLNHILVNDTYADIVATAGYALGLIKDGRASGALLDCLRNNQSPMRRGAAIEGLRNVEGAEATTAIEAALGDADPGVRRAAAEVLGSRGDKNSHGLLLKLARDDPDEGVRKAASEAAERTGPKAP
jgi:HEAT repeat protein